MEDPEFADFWQLLGYHDVITPEIQRMALAAEVFWPCEIYYHAPADVRDGLIHALLSAENSSAASNLMSCLAKTSSPDSAPSMSFPPNWIHPEFPYRQDAQSVVV